MNDWLLAPAGKFGRITRTGDSLQYGGEIIKLWGINNTFAQAAPEREIAKRRAAFYAKYGINSVRLHKYAEGHGWRGILSRKSFANFDPEGLDRMDFYIAQLRSRGIFVKLSPSFGPPRLMPEDLKTVPFATEFGTFEADEGSIRIPHSGIYFSLEIQQVHIQQMINLLQHRNPYTGLTYAEDPAIWDLEIINEQSVLFYTSSHALEQSPTLRNRVGRAFSDWLLHKYGSAEALEQTWGPEAFGMFDAAPSESASDGTILPLGNPHYWNLKTLDGPEAHRRERHLDTLEYLTGLQQAFYERYVKAVREAGYTGEISASNWQAGSSLSHFANLWTDAQIGTIDRHNYFGGSPRNPITGEREVDNGSMLARPGSGMLSTGMQQVKGLPFMLSEWIHVWPNEWGVEGPALIGAYGMGLQGWDVSYLFQNYDDGQFSPALARHRWDVSTPQIMGVFPAVARQVLRGDVAPATATASLKVHAPSLFDGGGFDFVDQLDQGYDAKVLQTDKVGPEVLAVAKVEVAFTPDPQPTKVFEMDPFRDGASLRSSTGQLRWMPAPDGARQAGYFSIDTDGTQALVGFAKGVAHRGRHGTIILHSRFGAVYVTAMHRDQSLSNDKRLLVTAVGAARNSGQAFNPTQTAVLSNGESPILMQGVHATLSLNREGPFSVQPLDPDGRLSGTSLAVSDQTFEINTHRWQTPYFLIQF